MNRNAVAAALLVSLTGCFGAEALQQVSSGYVGCPTDEVEISNDQPGFNQRSWDATCHGHLYHCAGVARSGLSCTEDRSSSEAPSSSTEMAAAVAR
jgi:hypothetical protein